MARIQLTKREIRAVERSIKHWEKDIQEPLKRGEKIVGKEDLTWKSSGEEVKCYDQDCPLCALQKAKFGEGYECEGCPYYRQYGHHCDAVRRNDFYGAFRDKLNLQTCNAMIQALRRIIEE